MDWSSDTKNFSPVEFETSSDNYDLYTNLSLSI
jgi:hypothetical protein